MKAVIVTLHLPIDDEATEDDAVTLGEAVKRIVLNDGSPETRFKPYGFLASVKLVTEASS